MQLEPGHPRHLHVGDRQEVRRKRREPENSMIGSQSSRSCRPASLAEFKQELVRRNEERILLEYSPDDHDRVRPHDVENNASYWPDGRGFQTGRKSSVAFGPK